MNSYQSIFRDYIPFFAEPVDSNISGVAMFIKNTYKVCEKPELKIPYSSKNKVEDLWAEIVNEIGEKHIVSVIYRHPKGNIKIFTEHLEHSLSKIQNDKTIKHSILTGDYNIDLIKFESNDNTNEYLKTVTKNGFVPTILLPTRITSHTCKTNRSYSLFIKTFFNTGCIRQLDDRYERSLCQLYNIAFQQKI